MNNDSEEARRGRAIALVTDWTLDRNLDIEIADKYNLADRILEVMADRDQPTAEGER